MGFFVCFVRGACCAGVPSHVTLLVTLRVLRGCGLTVWQTRLQQGSCAGCSVSAVSWHHRAGHSPAGKRGLLRVGQLGWWPPCPRRDVCGHSHWHGSANLLMRREPSLAHAILAPSAAGRGKTHTAQQSRSPPALSRPGSAALSSGSYVTCRVGGHCAATPL